MHFFHFGRQGLVPGDLILFLRDNIPIISNSSVTHDPLGLSLETEDNSWPVVMTVWFFFVYFCKSFSLFQNPFDGEWKSVCASQATQNQTDHLLSLSLQGVVFFIFHCVLDDQVSNKHETRMQSTK